MCVFVLDGGGNKSKTTSDNATPPEFIEREYVDVKGSEEAKN